MGMSAMSRMEDKGVGNRAGYGIAWVGLWGRLGPPETDAAVVGGVWAVRHALGISICERNGKGTTPSRQRSLCDAGLIKPWLARWGILEQICPINIAPIG